MAGNGPPPKKEAERRRRNKDVIPTEIINIDELIAGEVEIPEPDPDWHPIALMMFDAAKRSGQVIFMEPTDWASLYMMCESMSRDLKPQVIGIQEETGKPIMATIPLKGSSLNAYKAVMASLMFLEGDRRKLRLELERKKRIDAAAAGDGVVVDIVQRRQDAFRGA